MFSSFHAADGQLAARSLRFKGRGVLSSPAIPSPSQVQYTRKIREANGLLRGQAPQRDYALIDLHRDFANDPGLLKKEFSADGIHLTEAGYREWVEKVKPIIDNLCKKREEVRLGSSLQLGMRLLMFLG